MILVLDTSILIDMHRRNRKTLDALKKISAQYPYPAKITVFNSFEFIVGMLDLSVKKHQKALALMANFKILNTTDRSADIFAKLKKKYDKKGEKISLIDLLIAGIVIENNLTLVTKDRDFERIEELKKIII